MTANEIDNMSFEELARVSTTLTPEENYLWYNWGCDGRTYELIMIGRKSKERAERYRKELSV
jgi:hypothetical protein